MNPNASPTASELILNSPAFREVARHHDGSDEELLCDALNFVLGVEEPVRVYHGLLAGTLLRALDLLLTTQEQKLKLEQWLQAEAEALCD